MTARNRRVAGEKTLFLIGSLKEDLLKFPDPVKDGIGASLSVAQFGGKHPAVKPWKGVGPGVLEIVIVSIPYRAVYTVRFAEIIYVLHEKSTRGIATTRRDIDLIKRRLRAAREDYEVRYAKNA
jgi:phage-related protein